MNEPRSYFLEKALKLDVNDSLSAFKDRFVFNENEVYFDGNSLGRLPKETQKVLDKTIQSEWGKDLIRSWENKWIDLPRQTAVKIAELLGVSSEEVCVADNTSTNLYKLAFGALKFQKNRKIIITDELNFPTDQYILEGLIEQSFPNHQLVKLKSDNDGQCVDIESILSAINSEVALVCLSHVLYKSAHIYDMKTINAHAEKAGVLVLWDLSHSAGAIPLDLKALGCKMAVGCTYKFLNGGPGSSAFLYLDKDLITKFQNPIAGWFSHERPFDFEAKFTAKNSIDKFATGTPNVLSLVGIIPGVDLLLEAEMEALREKSLSLSSYFIELYNLFLKDIGFELKSPIKDSQRASHVTISHESATYIMKYLEIPEKNGRVFIPDFRPPNYIRIGLAPLYNSYREVFLFVERLVEIIGQKES
ncbi:kynureninase [Lacihabitans sp. LS3-19]|uniref:kynureninase n=1 Tax=Lacihabitans sp. LS3-19 TaxID=2487335 RepID=UPI0020CBCF01|nr:kynureninase [Lacihabitans sp. LS3-19]MCP9767325.1 kynureninase [Lacihabitans sp. LS3-19]